MFTDCIDAAVKINFNGKKVNNNDLFNIVLQVQISLSALVWKTEIKDLGM